MELFESKKQKEAFQSKKRKALYFRRNVLNLRLLVRSNATLPSSIFFHFWTSSFVFEFSIFFCQSFFFYRLRIILARPTALCAKLLEGENC